MPSTREHAVDDVDVPLMMDNDGNMRASDRGIVLREFVRRDVRKLMEGLVSINIRWKKIGDSMAKELADLLRKCPKVTSLDVQDNFVGCIGCMEISKALSHHKHITSLNLSGNRIADLGAAVLSSMLTVNTSLTHLDLSANKLEQQAMQGIGGGLRGNTTLKTLLLADNFFADEGAIELGWAISYNHTIHTLSIRGNEITSAGANMLAAGLSKNLGLVKLDLSDNLISDRGVIKLMDSLFKNTSLAELDLRNNQSLGADAKDAILDALDFSHRWEPISNDKRLAVAMALHPSLGESSSLFLIASIPTNPLKAALLSSKKMTPNDKTSLVMAQRSKADRTMPASEHYVAQPLTREESPLRQAVDKAINLRRRQVFYSGADATPSHD